MTLSKSEYMPPYFQMYASLNASDRFPILMLDEKLKKSLNSAYYLFPNNL